MKTEQVATADPITEWIPEKDLMGKLKCSKRQIRLWAERYGIVRSQMGFNTYYNLKSVTKALEENIIQA